MLQYSAGMSQDFLARRPPLTSQRPSFLEEEENRMMFRMIQEERFQTQMTHEEFLTEIKEVLEYIGAQIMRSPKKNGDCRKNSLI